MAMEEWPAIRANVQASHPAPPSRVRKVSATYSSAPIRARPGLVHHGCLRSRRNMVTGTFRCSPSGRCSGSCGSNSVRRPNCGRLDRRCWTEESLFHSRTAILTSIGNGGGHQTVMSDRMNALSMNRTAPLELFSGDPEFRRRSRRE